MGELGISYTFRQNTPNSINDDRPMQINLDNTFLILHEYWVFYWDQLEAMKKSTISYWLRTYQE